MVAVASSLTELFAPDLMSKRSRPGNSTTPGSAPRRSAYFRGRVPRARRDGEEALAFVVANATSRALQEACVAALVRKTEILWHLLDCVQAATARERRRDDRPRPGVSLARQARLQLDPHAGQADALYPEKGLELNDTAAGRGALPEERAVRHRRADGRAADDEARRARDRGRGAGLPARARGARPAAGARPRDVADATAPRPYTLIAELTYRCPLCCAYCSNPLDSAAATAS